MKYDITKIQQKVNGNYSSVLRHLLLLSYVEINTTYLCCKYLAEMPRVFCR